MAKFSVFFFCLLAALLTQGIALKCLVCSDDLPGNSTASCTEGTATLLECEATEEGSPFCLYLKGVIIVEASGQRIPVTQRGCGQSDELEPGTHCVLQTESFEFRIGLKGGSSSDGNSDSGSTGILLEEDGIGCACNDADGCNDSEASPLSSGGSASRPVWLALPSLALAALLLILHW